MMRAAGVAALAVALGACPGDDGPSDTEEEVALAPVEAVEQVRVYPHDPQAFTQGLVWHQGQLYESTGRYGASTLRRVELETGRVLQKVDLGRQYFAEGLALLGGSIYQLTWREGVAFVYDTAGLRQTGQRAYTGEGWGLATDGTSLIVSDGSHTLSFVDPATFAMQRTINVLDGGQPVFDLNELEYVRGEIWANVWHKPDVVRIDPRTGIVKGRINLSAIIPPEVQGNMEAVPNGIAYDEATGRLFVTGKLWPRLFEVRVPSLNLGGQPAGG
ncbi:MAG TPA: glutaminyl-peptide cyclotransferase [Longimicrobium sp.]|nr:glutaminyl-peptide cyclotransferase [Longimicrobium sp.]